uniref:Elongation factor P C-terminal domain-containing protein n=1 Tax=Vannella robusta TaxID=1487602 RepID=A0A7S4IJM8_9EUKA|mmetsp:Transcript_3598/g.4460  ORF Transcript_3598/g.4460 Transcript_3598/m.4460 type:complete len:229 (+) Transcript_3598:962-1648(+)
MLRALRGPRVSNFFSSAGLFSPRVIGVRDYKVQGNDLRKGDLVDIKGRVLEVVKTGFCKTGARGTAYTQLELRDVVTGKKKEDRVRTNEGVECYSTEIKEASFLSLDLTGKFVQGKPEGTATFELEDEVEGEDEVTISADRLPWPAMYYAEEFDEIKLSFYDEDKFYNIKVPDRVTVKVTKSDRIGNTAGTVTIENGRKITVPAHVKEGDYIVIKTANEEYMTKTSNM